MVVHGSLYIDHSASKKITGRVNYRDFTPRGIRSTTKIPIINFQAECRSIKWSHTDRRYTPKVSYIYSLIIIKFHVQATTTKSKIDVFVGISHMFFWMKSFCPCFSDVFLRRGLPSLHDAYLGLTDILRDLVEETFYGCGSFRDAE